MKDLTSPNFRIGKIGGEGEGRIKNNGFAVARGDVDFRILET